VPDLVASPLGDLHFFDGVPSLESVETIYDLLDLVREIEVYLNTLGARCRIRTRQATAEQHGLVARRVVLGCARSLGRHHRYQPCTGATVAPLP